MTEPGSRGDDEEVVLFERRGSVLLVTLNRPTRLNAWTAEMERRYFDLLMEAEDDPAIRAVVVTGAGQGFCAGADMDSLEAAARDKVVPDDEWNLPPDFPQTVRVPLIAAINGACVGIGLVQALYCDIRFAAADAKLSTIFARRGLIAEQGLSWLLPRLVGTGHAMDLLLSARIIDGREAVAMGLVNRVVHADELIEQAVAYAQELGTYSSPTSMAAIKQQVRRHADMGLAEALEDADTLMRESLAWPDLEEGVASFVERRPPRFQPLGPRPA